MSTGRAGLKILFASLLGIVFSVTALSAQEPPGRSAQDRALVAGNRAAALSDAGRYKEAAELLTHTLNTLKLEGEVIGPQIHATLLSNLAALYLFYLDQVPRVERLLKEALALLEKTAPESVSMSEVLKNLGIAYTAMGHLKEGQANLERALTVAEKVPNVDPGHLAAILTSLAGVHTMRKNWKKVEPLVTSAIHHLERAFGPNHPGVADGLITLSEMHQEQRQFVRAEAVLRRALAIRVQSFGPDSLSTAKVASRLATVVAAQDSLSEARMLFVSSLPVQERDLGPKSLVVLGALDEYAKVLRKMKDVTQAEVIESRAKDIRTELLYTVSANQLRR